MRQVLLFINLLFFFSTSLLGQSDFIVETFPDIEQYSETEESFLQKLNSQYQPENIRHIQITSVPAAIKNGTLDIDIPGEGCMYGVIGKQIKEQKNGDYSWYGELPIQQNGENCQFGFVHIYSKNGLINGTIQHAETNYKIISYGNKKHVLVKLAKAPNHHQGCAIEHRPPINIPLIKKNESTVANKTGGDKDACPIKILALYTTAALEHLGSTIEADIEACFDFSNTCLQNSSISPSTTSYELIDVLEIDFEETVGTVPDNTSLGSAISNLSGDIDRLITDDEANDLRNDHNADIIVLYAEGAYSFLGGVAGTLTLESERAYAIVDASRLDIEDLTAHEVGHIMGLYHQYNSTPGYGRGHTLALNPAPWWIWFKWVPSWWDLQARSTIMERHGDPIIPYYSNPDVNYSDVPTGIVNERDSARKICETACTVAAFRTDDDGVTLPLSVYLNGASYNCPCHSTPVLANVSGGASGGLQYQWQLSDNGFNWIPASGSGSTFFVSASCIEGAVKYVRVIVTDTDGQTAQSFHSVTAAMTWPGQVGECQQFLEGSQDGTYLDTNSNSKELVNSFSVFPNPAREFVNIKIDKPSAGTIRLFNMMGEQVLQEKVNESKFLYENQLLTDHLPKGIYVLIFETESTYLAERVIIQ